MQTESKVNGEWTDLDGAAGMLGLSAGTVYNRLRWGIWKGRVFMTSTRQGGPYFSIKDLEALAAEQLLLLPPARDKKSGC